MASIQEECGLFGIYSREGIDVAQETYLALYALQHRGQESCGIAVSDKGVFSNYKGVGLLSETFDEKSLRDLGQGQMAIGHVRYAPSEKGERIISAQPLVIRYLKGSLAIGHNGALVNAYELRKELEQNGAIFQTDSDAEIIAYIIARERINAGSVERAMANAMKKLKGAYSIVMMSPHKLIAARDPMGMRPLSLGRMNGSWFFSSETCAFDSIGAEFVREVEPGEVVCVDKDGPRSIVENVSDKTALCIFEYVYFARPDSVVEGQSVHVSRRIAGRILAQEHPVEADIVCGVPDSGIDAALGYAEQSGIPYGTAFIKNKYIGRTFIQDTQEKRERAVRIKLNVLSAEVKGKRVVLIDDSIVRGTTCAHIVQLLKEAGATEVHMRISSPPFLHPCFFGTDIKSRESLIACKMNLEEIRQSIKCDTLGYLSVEGIHKIAPNAKIGFCDACFTGKYPMDVPDELPYNKFLHKYEK